MYTLYKYNKKRKRRRIFYGTTSSKRLRDQYNVSGSYQACDSRFRPSWFSSHSSWRRKLSASDTSAPITTSQSCCVVKIQNNKTYTHTQLAFVSTCKKGWRTENVLLCFLLRALNVWLTIREMLRTLALCCWSWLLLCADCANSERDLRAHQTIRLRISWERRLEIRPHALRWLKR